MTATATKKGMRPLREGMFEMPESLEGKPRLYAQRCTACGEVFNTTQRAFCANCGKPALERVLLGTQGTIYTYTIVHQALRGSLMTPPYVIAQIRMPEGVVVQTIMTGLEPAQVRIGMPVEICLKEVSQSEEGEPLVTYFFRPLEAA